MNIKFLQNNKIPLVLALDVDGTRVYYNRKTNDSFDDSFEFVVEYATEEEAMEIVKEVIQVIKSEHEEPHHGVTWITTSLEVTEVSERYHYVVIEWKYRIRDIW